MNVGGLLGKKIGMTQVWDEHEVLRPATVLEVGPCVVLQVKTQELDGYSALQLGFEEKTTRRRSVRERKAIDAREREEEGRQGERSRPRRRAVERRGASWPEICHARKADTTPRRFVREVGAEPGHDYAPGQELTVEIFAEFLGEKDKEGKPAVVPLVDVIGVTKGKGFQGTVKRHGHSRGPESHGSMNVRRPGSIGQSASPSRVFPGTAMPGHMGHVRHTEHNLRVLRIDRERNLLVVGGAVPGPPDGYIMVRPASRVAARKKA